MSLYDISGNLISSDGGFDSEFFEILAGNGDKVELDWATGSISTDSGVNISSSTRLRTTQHLNLDSLRYLFIHCPEGYKFGTRIYSATSSTEYDSYLAFKEGNQIIKHEKGKIYRFILAFSDNAAIALDDLPEDFYIIPVYYPRWAEEAEAQSIGPYTTSRNNIEYVDELLTVANTYYSHRNDYIDGERVMVYGNTTTIFDIHDNTYTNNIDCSTFVGLCLRGIPFSQTSYADKQGRPAETYLANSDYVWSMNPYDFNTSKNKTSTSLTPSRRTSQLAEWFINQRRAVPKDPKFVNIDVGDVVFWSRNTGSAPMNPHRFMLINHVALIKSKRRVTVYDSNKTYALWETVEYNGALYECKTAISTPEAWTSSHWTKIYDTWNCTKVPYCHIVLESTSGSPTIQTHILERSWDDPSNLTQNNYNTLSLVCRPDLGGL